MNEADDITMEWACFGNVWDNAELISLLRRYPEHREELIDFCSAWRAMAIIDRCLPPPPIDPKEEKRLVSRAVRKAMRRFDAERKRRA